MTSIDKNEEKTSSRLV